MYVDTDAHPGLKLPQDATPSENLVCRHMAGGGGCNMTTFSVTLAPRLFGASGTKLPRSGMSSNNVNTKMI